MWNHIPAEALRRNYGLASGWFYDPSAVGVMLCPLCDGKGRL